MPHYHEILPTWGETMKIKELVARMAKALVDLPEEVSVTQIKGVASRLRFQA
jgi:hypothetical protein